MIISDKYKFVFIEFPQTGCSAVARELMENYDGRRILFKHAQYHEFLKQAKPEELGYYSFSTIRNPMDVVVSKYFKYKSDHENYANKKVKHGKLRRLLMPKIEESRRDFIINSDADFEQFFLKYYKWPYSAWSILSHHKLDFLMRFESLSDDFEKALHNLAIKPVRGLPLYNKTSMKKKHFTEYYASKASRKRALKVFGPYMKAWNYEFPNDWKELELVKSSTGMYNFINIFRRLYWIYLR